MFLHLGWPWHCHQDGRQAGPNQVCIFSDDDNDDDDDDDEDDDDDDNDRDYEDCDMFTKLVD